MTLLELILQYQLNRPGIEILLDLISIYNQGYRLEPHQVEFGDPQDLDTRPDILDDTNSFIPAEVDASVDSRLVPGNTGFLYARLPLGVLKKDKEYDIDPLPVPFSTYQILDQINDQYNTQLTEDDLEDTEYVSMDDWFYIHAKPSSKVWIGTKRIDVVGDGPKFVLFVQSFLNGFTAYDPLDPDPEITMPYRQSSDARVTGLANTQNNTSWVLGIDFEFGEVESVSGPGNKNARIKINSLKDGYEDQWLYVHRLPTSDIGNQPAENFEDIQHPGRDFTIHEILDEINAALKLSLTPEELEDTHFEADNENVYITITDQSKCWQPGIYALSMSFTQNVRLVDDSYYRIRGVGLDTRTYA